MGGMADEEADRQAGELPGSDIPLVNLEERVPLLGLLVPPPLAAAAQILLLKRLAFAYHLTGRGFALLAFCSRLKCNIPL